MLDFIKLIRLPNIILLFIIQYCVRNFILVDAANDLGGNMVLSSSMYYKLVLSTLFIAAGGYVINDIYDQKTDATNKPDKVLVGVALSEKSAYILYYMINILAILLIINYIPFIVLHASCIVLLYLYAYWGKRQFALGNLLISFLCVIPIVELFYWEGYLFVNNAVAQYYLFILKSFCLFVFQATLIREIIKDIEDIKGDFEVGRGTFPIVLGIKNTKWMLCVLILILLGQLVYFNSWLWQNAYHFTALYVAFLLMLPLFIMVGFIYNAQEKAHYQRLSLGMKIYFVFGLGFILFYNY